jgi:hypothetical protein
MELIGSVMNEMKGRVHEMERKLKDNNIRNDIDEQMEMNKRMKLKGNEWMKLTERKATDLYDQEVLKVCLLIFHPEIF